MMGICYDAPAESRILGLPCDCRDHAPDPADGEIVIYYGGWDLRTLRSSAGGKQRMWQDQDWYEKYGWQAEPGYYRLLLPVPRCNRKTWSEQLRHLQSIDPAWQPAPVCVAATALLVHLTETGNDLLRHDWCRCAEALPSGSRTALTVSEGRVGVYSGWGGYRYAYVWSSAARKC